MSPSGSPPPFEASIIFSGRSPTLSPTPAQDSERPGRSDSIFWEYRSLLKAATTLVTFKWDNESSKGILVPIPYPLDAEGQPIEPMGLPEFLGEHRWDRPSCFCAMLGPPREAQFFVPTLQESPAFGMMCLLCPECPYFVNVSELIELHKNEIMAVKDKDTGDDDSSILDNDIPKASKKKKHDLRGIRPKEKEASPTNIIGSSPSHPIELDTTFELDDSLSAGLSSVVTNLGSIHGALQEQFSAAFGLCDECKRIVSYETLRLKSHVCVIEVED